MSDAQAPARLWLVGAGNMGGAMLRRWVASGIASDRITVIDPGSPAVPEGVRVLAEAPDGDAPDILILAVKPQMIDAVAEAICSAEAAMLVSILAGVEVAALRSRFAARAIVRAMPNLSVAIGKGVVALHGDSEAPALRAAAEALMAPLGHVEWVEEALFDVVTALSGSGPGFTYRFIDALAKGGEALGLPTDQALRLARATVEGSAMLAAQADETPAILADRVASPGGSTREGLNVLDADAALVRLLTDTLAAATRRNAELAAAARS
ncbi:pyrroline-5-carboxylate reductase [Sphingomonas spermidinifaciens]|uniref:Pyrroline-5-carboxylate reductase n=1 Tax=Sphingomonas spermidinifaciens TaxID=1141889 RepID=A0A2A4B724_9SPHN|nr:pyrroline-5-carboxylate reductase [Sphingomonas spermidinifaciens]PCD03589.1 pyrroline-5-carboxylate reductase [Sphingomonas spermidinifaciens]